jgi:hypothetical protein
LTSPQTEALRGSDELLALMAEFPAYLFWREGTVGHSRYVACGLNLQCSPHAVITGDLAELGRVLREGRQRGCAAHANAPTGGPGGSQPDHPPWPHSGGSLIITARELMVSTVDLPDSKHDLLAVLSQYRHALFSLVMENCELSARSTAPRGRESAHRVRDVQDIPETSQDGAVASVNVRQRPGSVKGHELLHLG